jgi:hypothetical protein
VGLCVEAALIVFAHPRSVAVSMVMTYIPRVEDAIWLNFLRLCFREERLHWDPEQCEQLTLQAGELRLEHLDGVSVLD